MTGIIRLDWKRVLFGALVCVAYLPLSYPFLFGPKVADIFTATVLIIVLAILAMCMIALNEVKNAVSNKFWNLGVLSVTSHLLVGLCFCIPEMARYESLQTIGGVVSFFLFIVMWATFRGE